MAGIFDEQRLTQVKTVSTTELKDIDSKINIEIKALMIEHEDAHLKIDGISFNTYKMSDGDINKVALISYSYDKKVSELRQELNW